MKVVYMCQAHCLLGFVGGVTIFRANLIFSWQTRMAGYGFIFSRHTRRFFYAFCHSTFSEVKPRIHCSSFHFKCILKFPLFFYSKDELLLFAPHHLKCHLPAWLCLFLPIFDRFRARLAVRVWKFKTFLTRVEESCQHRVTGVTKLLFVTDSGSFYREHRISYFRILFQPHKFNTRTNNPMPPTHPSERIYM